MVRIFCIGCIITVLFSCVEEARPDDLKVINRIEERRKEYLKDVLDRCKQDAITRAELYVDSLLSEQIQISLNDSIYFPLKPIKPESKGVIILEPYVKPEPIFLDSVIEKK
ncbi:MAG: hypothetical protein WAT79_13455 [Saprospiraceae bacterium]